ncbi:hypothetical protein GN956_G26939 [Arapaima gigas]
MSCCDESLSILTDIARLLLLVVYETDGNIHIVFMCGNSTSGPHIRDRQQGKPDYRARAARGRERASAVFK